MKIIDGAQGEGGGQIFRSSLTLAICLGIPVTIQRIRAGRKNPGLLRQHLMCLRAAQEICDAKVEGAELGSTQVSFIPGKIKSGDYKFSVGSAGSSTLVFQTVFLPLALADGVSKLTLEGGTHNAMAPSYDFIAQSFLPEMKKIGINTETVLEKYGFYPAGGGQWHIEITPTKKLAVYNNFQRGALLNKTAIATSAKIPRHVTQREINTAQQLLGWSECTSRQECVQSAGPGNIFSLRLALENITEVVEVVGEPRLSAEQVAKKAVREMQRYLASDAVVGEHLADQLLLPMALGSGGKFTTLEPSQHLLTNAAVITQLTNIHIDISPIGDGVWQVEM